VRRSNCFFFAWYCYLIRYRMRGYCAIRRTRPPLTVGFHWSYCTHDRKHWLHFEPVHREKRWWLAAIHKLWFTGRIRRYDTEWRGD